MSDDFLKLLLRSALVVWAVFLGCYASLAKAETTYPYAAIKQYRYCQTTPQCNSWVNDPVSACSAFAAASTATANNPVTWYVAPPLVTLQQLTCTIKHDGIKRADGSYSVNPNSEARAAYTQFACPSGGVLSGASCIRDPNLPVDPCSDKNEFLRRWDYGKATVTPAPNHYGECVVTVVKMNVCRKEPSGVTYCMWTVKRTGELYKGPPDDGGGNGSDAPDAPSLPPVPSPAIKAPAPTSGTESSACPAGTVQAGAAADGTPICMGTGTTPKNPPAPRPKLEIEKNETLPDGSTQNTKNIVTTNSDGSTTTQTIITITRPDGSKETSGGVTTGNNSAGGQGVSDTPEDDKYDLCKQNPNLSICRESSVAGTCGEITCVGDAIQCATLRAAAAMECRDKQDRTEVAARPETALGQAILSGSDPMKGAIDSAIKGTSVDFSETAGNLDSGGFVGARSCIANKTFSALGQSLTVEFDYLCEHILPIRFFVMALASLYAYLTISRAALGI